MPARKTGPGKTNHILTANIIIQCELAIKYVSLALHIINPLHAIILMHNKTRQRCLLGH